MTTSKNVPYFPMEKDLFGTKEFELIGAILFERFKTRVEKHKGRELTDELMIEVSGEANKFLTEIIDLIS